MILDLPILGGLLRDYDYSLKDFLGLGDVLLFVQSRLNAEAFEMKSNSGPTFRTSFQLSMANLGFIFPPIS